MDGSSYATLAAARPQIEARCSSDNQADEFERACNERRTHKRTRKKIAVAEISSQARLIFKSGLTSFGCSLSIYGNSSRTCLLQMAMARSRSGG
jgi:hypothetical protein